MTTIAWDGRKLAADRASWSGGVRRTVRKVFKINHAERGELLVAICGSASYATLVLQWLRGEIERPDPLKHFSIDDLDRIAMVAIDRDKRIWEIGRDLIWTELKEAFYATGAGHEFAWGALEAGAGAIRAIEIAAKRSDMAGLGVDWIHVDGTEGSIV